MRDVAVACDGVRDGARDEGPTAAVPCPRCGRPTTWVRCDRGTFHSIEELRVGCACALSDDEWTDLADEADARIRAEYR
jgi:hypothetical protein